MITYLERTEIVPHDVEPDFSRILYDSVTEVQDIADLAILIPVGTTIKHYCNHDTLGPCTTEQIP